MDATNLQVVNELQDELDILSHSIPINLYTQICFCYPVADAALYPGIVDTLRKGLERLSASFPWVAGQVTVEKASEGSSGVFKVKPFEKIPPLKVKDLRGDASAPTMDTLRQANFPFRMLDEGMIAPSETFTKPSQTILPVFLVQVNYIVGGLIITMNGQHHMMDMTGQGQLIDLFSKACHGEPFTSEEISIGNMPRRSLVPFLDDSYKQGPELAFQIIKASPSPLDPNGPPPPKCSWVYFTFSSSSLAALKALASQHLTLPPGGFVSTDDALTAFVWQSIMRARRSRLDPVAEVVFSRAVDVRRHLGIPSTYMGLMQNMTYHSSPLGKLIGEPLGGVASGLRAAVDPKTSNLTFATRALVTAFERTPDKSKFSFTANMDMSKDIMLSSWAKMDFHHLDFNLGLGKPEEVRRPQFTPVESLIYLMPKSPDGEIAVAFGLRDEDIENLKADPEFTKYATYVG